MDRRKRRELSAYERSHSWLARELRLKLSQYSFGHEIVLGRGLGVRGGLRRRLGRAAAAAEQECAAEHRDRQLR